MIADDEYFTIESPAETKIKIKGSRFIGSAAPTQSVKDAKKYITAISKQFYNASHHCYAFRIKENGQVVTRASDDREPAGTAGSPILKTIVGRNLLDITVVVTRYFGGTKLGKGGLIRAYTSCSQEVLDICEIMKKQHLIRIAFSISYAFTGTIMHHISQIDGKIISSDHSDHSEYVIEIPQSLAENFKKQLIEATSGNLTFLPCK